MKRGTPDHPKTRLLAAKLKLKRFQAVGVLESIWHFTAQYAKRGDIGKWSDEEIASAIEWDGDPSELIAALVAARLLDEDPTHRLLVHDWETHADQTVIRSDEVKKLGFARPMLANASNCSTNASQPTPEPSQSHSQSQSPTPAATPQLDFARVVFPDESWRTDETCTRLQEWVDARAKRHPPLIDPEERITAWMRLYPSFEVFRYSLDSAIGGVWATLQTIKTPPETEPPPKRRRVFNGTPEESAT